MTTTGYRILDGEELLEPNDCPRVALAARQWMWVGCTCRPLGFVAQEFGNHLKLSVVHDENCPTIGMPTHIHETER